MAVSAIRIAEGTIEMSTLKFSADGVELFFWRDLSAASRNKRVLPPQKSKREISGRRRQVRPLENAWAPGNRGADRRT